MDNENGGSNVNYIYGDMLTERAKAFTGLESGSIWFVCFLPLLGLFLENFAVSKWAGAFLWVSVIILMPVCCAADLRRIKKLETDGRSIKKLEKSVLLAPLYVYRREKYCMRETYKAIMLVVFSMAAVIMNGFTQGLSVHEGSVPVLLRNTYVQNLDNFSGSSQNVIGEQLEEYLGEDAEWDCKKSGDVYTAVCSGVHRKHREADPDGEAPDRSYWQQKSRFQQIRHNGDQRELGNHSKQGRGRKNYLRHYPGGILIRGRRRPDVQRTGGGYNWLRLP